MWTKVAGITYRAQPGVYSVSHTSPAQSAAEYTTTTVFTGDQ